jgi:phage shock protein A
MALLSRLGTIFKSKASKALDKAEDPRETLDYSYEKMNDMLRQTKAGVAEVATARKRVEMQAEELKKNSEKFDAQARQALQQNREDLAAEALRRKALLVEQFQALQPQYEQLKAKEDKLVEGSRRLQTKIDVFRTQKETIKASYTAAEAQSRVGAAVSGISEEMGDVGLAMERAKEKTAQLEARAAGIDELTASGALPDLTAEPGDDIAAELNRMSNEGSVNTELERMKAELGMGANPQALDSGSKDEENK